MIRLHIDERAFEVKPVGSEIGGIKKRLQGRSTSVRVSISDLTQKIGNGHTISPAVMGGTSASDWQEQQLFMVDIDNGREDTPILTAKQALEICTKYSLPPVFYYYTFSHSKEKPKFRFAFVMNKIITEEFQRQIIMDSLISLFPQSDVACANADRLFFGTNKTVKICDEEARITFEDILRLYTPPTPPKAPAFAKHNDKENSDHELDELKRNFDLLGYMEERNGNYHPSSKWAVFENCEICGHKNDLAYNQDTNSWYCFSSNGRVGGSIIDYLIHADGLTVGQAIDKFKYELCGLERPEEKWAPPTPLEDVRLPSFPVNCLPKPIGDFVQAIADNTETAVDMAAVCALALIASSVQGKFEIVGKDDHHEQLNLYILLIARSGERKSAIVRMMTKPIYAYEEKENSRRLLTIAQQEARLNILDLEIKKHEKKGEYEKASELRVERKELERTKMKLLRFIADDATPEVLTTMLANNNGVLTIISTEGGLFDTLSGRYSSMVSIDTLLKAYTGDYIRVDREGRESETISHPALTMLISAQENVLDGLLSNVVFSDRGLTARIMYCKPTSKIGTRKYETPNIPTGLKEAYNMIILELLNIPLPPNGATALLRLSKEAFMLSDQFFNWIEPQLVNDLDNTRGWGEKLHGTMLRIAGVIHCAEYRDASAKTLIDEKTIKKAIKISKYFLEHAKYAFSLMGADKPLQGAKYILRKLTQQQLRMLTRYQIFRLCRGKYFSKTEDVSPALSLLIELGYIKEQFDPSPTGGRPKGSVYILNPLYFDNDIESGGIKVI
ncbi:MAG TPA: YfjI family protein [Desulfosporosinus sp.]|nr:YfjI family protein [Desulfosporosinus sp.]